MAAKKGVGHVKPDRTIKYAVVEKPTSGTTKGQITKIYAQNLSWDDAQKEKRKAARHTWHADVVPQSQLPAPTKAPKPSAVVVAPIETVVVPKEDAPNGVGDVASQGEEFDLSDSDDAPVS